MRLLMVAPTFPPTQCGVGDYTFQVCKHLAEDLGVRIVVATGHSPLAEKIEILRGDIEVVRGVRKWNFPSIGWIKKIAGEINPDIVHIQYHSGDYGRHPAINFLPSLLNHRYKIVTTLHNLTPPRILRRVGMRKLVEACDRIIVTNEIDQKECERSFPDLMSKIVKVPVGAGKVKNIGGDYRRDAVRNSLNLSPEDVVFSYFGFINSEKGLDTLLLAFGELRKENPNAKLLIVGGLHSDADAENVGYHEHIESLAEDLGVNESITWTGFCGDDELSKYLLASDVCVLPFKDGVSTKRSSFMSVLAHGLATITTRGEVLPEGLEDGENVLLARPNDPGDLLRQMERLAQNEELRARLGRGAERLLEEHYSWDRINSEMMRVYSEVER
ncbi:MAG: glycosyltransferase family 4 protein [bacterium]